MWELRIGELVGRRGAVSRELVARKRMADGRLGAATISVVLPWKSDAPVREQEERCRDLFVRWVKEIAAQDELPIRR